MTPKEKARNLVNHFIIEIDYDSVSNAVWRNPMDKNEHIRTMKDAKRYSLIVVDENVKMLKLVLNESTEIYQSLNTPKKLCIDLLNPLLKYWEEVKQEIEKL